MGREKKKKITRRVKEPTGGAPESTTNKTAKSEPPNLAGMSGEWQEFYRQVINQLS